ncbi:MAG: hypothetical protein ACTSSF_05340 [Candidatus Heimdallarchaeaceae archaeon]
MKKPDIKKEENNEQPKKKSILKKLALFFVFLEVSVFITSIAMFISAIVISDFDKSWRLASIAGGLFMGSVGSSMALFIVFAVISAIKGRSQFTPIRQKDVLRVPYTTGKSSSTKTFLCEYCGYKVTSKDKTCPRCGGPITEV